MDRMTPRGDMAIWMWGRSSVSPQYVYFLHWSHILLFATLGTKRTRNKNDAKDWPVIFWPRHAGFISWCWSRLAGQLQHLGLQCSQAASLCFVFHSSIFLFRIRIMSRIVLKTDLPLLRCTVTTSPVWHGSNKKGQLTPRLACDRDATWQIRLK